MSNRISDCLAFTIGPGPAAGGQEGPYSDTPGDPGGPTNFGVTQASWSDWLHRPVTADEIRGLLRPDVIPFYSARYWNALRCWSLPPGVDLQVFDFGVNAGPGNSARELQLAVGATVDLIVGSMTALAARGVGAAALIPALHAAHEAHYRANAQFYLFGDDWLRRNNECQAAALIAAGL